jgi:hypothetical protein
MTQNNNTRNMSLYIPVVFCHVQTSVIEKTFEKLDIGKVTKVDRVPVMVDQTDREGNPGQRHKHDQVFVHLQWNTNSIAAMNLYDAVAVDGASAKLVYDEPYYWALYKNKNPEQSAIREQGMRIQEQEERLKKQEQELTATHGALSQLAERVNTLEGGWVWDQEDWRKTPINNFTNWVSSPIPTDWSSIPAVDSLESWEGDTTPDPFGQSC